MFNINSILPFFWCNSSNEHCRPTPFSFLCLPLALSRIIPLIFNPYFFALKYVHFHLILKLLLIICKLQIINVFLMIILVVHKDHQVHQMVIFVLRMGPMTARAASRFSTMEVGEQCVMMIGPSIMQKWCVGS